MRRPTIRLAVTVHSAIVFVAGATLGAAGFALATPVGPAVAPRVAVVSAVKIDEEILGEPATATTFEVTFAPGAAGAPHRHPGPIFGYVLEGDFEFAVGDAPVRTLEGGRDVLRAGDGVAPPFPATPATNRTRGCWPC